MTKRVAPLNHKQIAGPAAAAFQSLPNNLRQSILFHLEDRPHAVLYDKREIVEAWLTWEGIHGFTDQIIELVRTTYAAQEAPALKDDERTCDKCGAVHSTGMNIDGQMLCPECWPESINPQINLVRRLAYPDVGELLLLEDYRNIARNIIESASSVIGR